MQPDHLHYSAAQLQPMAFLLYFILLSLAWAVYWAVIRPVLLQKVMYDFEVLRSSVDWSIIEEQPFSSGKAAQRLASDLETSAAAQSLSVGVILYFCHKNRAELRARAAEETERFRDLPGWLREAHQKDIQLTLKAALLNSPIWWMPIAIIYLLAVFSQKVQVWWNEVSLGAVEAKNWCAP